MQHLQHVCSASQKSTNSCTIPLFRANTHRGIHSLRSGALCFHRPRYSGIAAVSNLGNDSSWTAHPFSAANTYGYGRLAWNPRVDPGVITTEWIGATYGVGDTTVTTTVLDILMSSWEVSVEGVYSQGCFRDCSCQHFCKGL